ncbi:hypothetical protein FVE85_4645 [Porphyridium purpureum]|uniref:Uncharacterized protein n=1 Tax=Porphyridium purpureum TaxID=35688 RepID=A0A5J4YQB7_PORPP|nr:hypothetical protein FVE85_4645 [Porphyridium purpureum]|eukprot:POR9856..scf236_6
MRSVLVIKSLDAVETGNVIKSVVAERNRLASFGLELVKRTGAKYKKVLAVASTDLDLEFWAHEQLARHLLAYLDLMRLVSFETSQVVKRID